MQNSNAKRRFSADKKTKDAAPAGAAAGAKAAAAAAPKEKDWTKTEIAQVQNVHLPPHRRHVYLPSSSVASRPPAATRIDVTSVGHAATFDGACEGKTPPSGLIRYRTTDERDLPRFGMTWPCDDATHTHIHTFTHSHTHIHTHTHTPTSTSTQGSTCDQVSLSRLTAAQ